jgi:hypothetical protein
MLLEATQPEGDQKSVCPGGASRFTDGFLQAEISLPPSQYYALTF